MRVSENKIKTFENINYTDDLEEIFNNLSVNKINDLLFYFGYEIKNANKNDKITDLIELYKDKRELKKLIELLTIEEFEFLKTILNKNGTMDVLNIEKNKYLKLYKMRIIDLFGNFDNSKTYSKIAIIPEIIKESLKKINLEDYKNQVENNTNYLNTLKAVINCYGMFNKNAFEKIVLGNYKNINIEKTLNSVAYILSLMKYPIKLIKINNEIFYIYNDLTNKTNYIIDRIYLLDKERKQLNFSDLIKFKDDCYYEDSKEISKFIDYLNEAEYSEDQINEILKCLLLEVRTSIPNMFLIYTKILEYKPYTNYEKCKEFTELIGNIIEKQKTWINLTGKEVLSLNICSCCGKMEEK